MKTLKKTLCLVLAVVMVVGVLVLPANAATTTAADTEATAAFDTLNEYGVMNGVDANNKPALDKNINRQDMAAIVYRIMTGDTENKYVGNYVGSAAKFADSATFATWAKGYIGYVRNQGIFVGDEKGNFKPTDNITGDEVLTVLLRCIGYGQNGEFTGAYWAENAETLATQIHLFGGTKRYSVKADMSQVINRGTVAKLTSNAVDCPMVTYYNGAYSDSTVDGRPVAPNTADAKTNLPLINTGSEAGKLDSDDWAVPSQTFTSYVYFNYPQTKVATSTETSLKPVKEYYHAITQCDLADDLGLTKETEFTVYVNGEVNKTTIKVDPLNTAAEIGAQGRHTLVYDLVEDDKNTPDTIIYIDTLLAEVTDVTKATFDRNNHLEDPATLTLDVYTQGTAQKAVLVSSDSKDYEYAVGDMLLVKYIQNGISSSTNDVSGASAEAKVILGSDDRGRGKNVEVLGLATSTVAAQTVIYHNQNKHDVGGTVYADNNRYHLDGAGAVAGTYTWYFDNSPEGKNLIGSKQIATSYAYGVITRIWAEIVDRGDTKVKAEVVYMDGATATIEVGNIVYYKGSAVNTAIGNDDTNIDGGIATYTNEASSTKPLMKKSGTNDASNNGIVYVSNSWQDNLAADKAAAGATDYAGILNDHLFKFIPSGSKINLVEVAGNNTAATIDADHGVLTGLKFDGMGNATTDILKGRATNSNTGTVEVDGNTVFLVRSGNGSTVPYTWKTYVGFKNIVDFDSGEVDYVNTDKDDAAEFVYITASATTSADAGEHIFVSTANNKTDEGASSWKLDYSYDTTNGVYTVNGWLDGKEGSVKVKDAGIVANFITGQTGFNAWLVTITNGYVTDIDGTNVTHANKPITDSASTEYTTGVELDQTNGMNTPVPDMYKGQSVIVHTVSTAATLGSDTVKLNGVTGTFTYDGNPVYGNWSDLKKEDTVAVFVYDTDTKAISQAYIFRAASGSSYAPGESEATGSLEFEKSSASASATSGSDEITVSGLTLKGSDDYENDVTTITATIERFDRGYFAWGTATADDVTASSSGGALTTLTASSELQPGEYRLTITATSADKEVTATVQLSFTVS